MRQDIDTVADEQLGVLEIIDVGSDPNTVYMCFVDDGLVNFGTHLGGHGVVHVVHPDLDEIGMTLCGFPHLRARFLRCLRSIHLCIKETQGCGWRSVGGAKAPVGAEHVGGACCAAMSLGLQ